MLFPPSIHMVARCITLVHMSKQYNHCHIDIGKNSLGAEGARVLAGVLGGCKALAHHDLGLVVT